MDGQALLSLVMKTVTFRSSAKGLTPASWRGRRRHPFAMNGPCTQGRLGLETPDSLSMGDPACQGFMSWP